MLVLTLEVSWGPVLVQGNATAGAVTQASERYRGREQCPHHGVLRWMAPLAITTPLLKEQVNVELTCFCHLGGETSAFCTHPSS